MTLTLERPTVDLAGRAAAIASGQLRLAGESRNQEFRSELRATETMKGDKSFITLRGYASTVNQPYTMYDMFGEYDEVMDGGAFDLTLSNSPDVAFLLNHTGMTMARTTNGTLRLSADSVGLLSEADLNPLRSDVQDLRLAIDDQNVDQMSFAFRIVDGQWNDRFTQYTITQVDLNRGDVSAVNYGANPNTSISARAVARALEQLSHVPLALTEAHVEARRAALSGPVETPSPVVATGNMNAATAARIAAL